VEGVPFAGEEISRRGLIVVMTPKFVTAGPLSRPSTSSLQPKDVDARQREGAPRTVIRIERLLRY
jgi:hypothetical protein